MNNDMHFGQGGQFNQCGQKHRGCAWILKFGFRFRFQINNLDLKFHEIRCYCNSNPQISKFKILGKIGQIQIHMLKIVLTKRTIGYCADFN